MGGKADTSATFEINLEDGTSGPAEEAANALKNLRNTIDADKKALAQMQRAMKDLNGATVVNVAQARALREQIEKKKQAIADATGAYVAMGGSFSRTASKGQSVKGMLEQLTKQAKGVPGPLGAVAGRVEALRAALGGGVVALGLMAIVAGLVALTAATAAAVGVLAAYGVGQANARRSELLRLEGLTKIRSIYGWVAGNAREMQGAIDSVSASSSLGRDQIYKYTEQLYRAGLRGQNLQDALEGVAIKAQVQGEAQAQLFASHAAGAALAGQSVRKLADDVKARLGGIAAAQMLDLNVQTQKLHENFDALFRDLKVEGFAKSVKSVADLLSQSTVSGRALKALTETILQPLIDMAEAAAPYVKRFFQGMILGAQNVTIAVLRVALWFKKTFGTTELFSGLRDMNAAVLYGKIALGLLVGALIAVAVPFAILGAQMLAVGAIAHAMWRGFKAVFGFLSDISKRAAAAFSKIDWASLGHSIATGLVRGLQAGSKLVLAAVKNLGVGAWKSFKSALGIASPSKAFAKLGLAIPQGIQVGVQAGTPAAQRSVASAISVPSIPADTAPAPAAAPRSAQGSKAPITIQIDGVNVYSNAADAGGLAADFRRELEHVLESVALQLGAKMEGA